MPSSCAFLFLPEVEVTSLLMRKLVAFDTLPATFPPAPSMYAFSAARFGQWCTSPVITNVSPAHAPPDFGAT